MPLLSRIRSDHAAGEHARDAESQAELVEVDVARLLDRLAKVDVAVALLVPAAEIAVAEEVAAGARMRHVVVQTDDAGLEAHDRRRELERRAGRIQTLNHLVVQRTARIVAELRVVRRRDAADEPVGIEARRAVNREHVARLRVHGHHAALQRVAEQRRRELSAGRDRCSCTADPVTRGAMSPRPPASPTDASARVDLDEVRAFLAAKLLLVLSLESRLADRPAPACSRGTRAG